MDLVRNKYKKKRVRVIIDAGEAFNEESIKLPAGICIGYGVVVYGDDANTIPIDISIKDGGNEVEEPLSHKFLEKTSGGRYIDSLIPANFVCDINADIRCTAIKVLPAGAIVDIFFLIKQDQS